MQDEVRVLYVDDDVDRGARVAERLEAADGGLEVVTASDVETGVERLETGAVDCLVVVPALEAENGMALLSAARRVDPGLPVLYHGDGAAVDVADVLDRGVTSFVQRCADDGVAVLQNRIRNCVATHHRLGFFEAISEETADVLTVLDDDGTIAYVSPSVERVLGYEPAELEGADPIDYVHPADCAAVSEAFEAVGDGVETREHEYRWRAADGSWLWVQSAFRDRTDTPIDGHVVTSRNITERKQRELELESRERILEELGDAIYALDGEGAYRYINPAGSHLSGFDREAIQAEGPSLLHPEADLERFEEVIGDLASDEDRRVETVEASMKTIDGGELPIEVSLTVLEEDGEFQGSVGVVRDISERKERERELMEYEAILQALPDEVAILNTDGVMTHVIPPTGEDVTMSGYEPEELVGEPVSKVMPEEHMEAGIEKIEELVTTDKERTSYEMEILTKDGERHEREDHLALFRDDDGNIEGTVGVLRDIEERKAYERALEAQNERLENFASIVSHDLRNPLNVAKGRVDLAQSERDDENLDIAMNSLERMEALIQDLLALAREGDDVAEIEPVEFDELAQLCWGHVSAPEASLEVDAVGRVMADDSRLQQLLENLYRNALDHVGSDVSIRVEPIDGGFAVEDDGPGIPPERREAVFETGVSGGDGTGFGLAIVDQIAAAHGWDVTVTDGRQGGARFEFTGVESVE